MLALPLFIVLTLFLAVPAITLCLNISQKSNNPDDEVQFSRNGISLLPVLSLCSALVSTLVFCGLLSSRSVYIIDGRTKDEVNVGWTTWRSQDRRMLNVTMAVSLVVSVCSLIAFSRLIQKFRKIPRTRRPHPGSPASANDRSPPD